MTYKLEDLQENCPCARCHESRSRGEKPLKNLRLGAKGIENVGQYAIRIRFSEGCSLGIYDFESLYAMGEV